MKLGDKVSFYKSFIKNRNIPFGSDTISDEQQQIYEDDGCFNVDRYIAKEHGKKEGFIAGKRTICTAYDMTYDDEGIGEYLKPCGNQAYSEIYLIATNMNGFSKVKKEWIITE